MKKLWMKGVTRIFLMYLKQAKKKKINSRTLSRSTISFGPNKTKWENIHYCENLSDKSSNSTKGSTVKDV
jgi:hypothetical protein